MGVPHFDDFERLRVIVWATAVLTKCEGKSAPARWLFAGPDSTRASTLFNRCLAEGRPWPELCASANEPGPALKIEERYPGTLIWLIHPFWNAMRCFDDYSVERVHLEVLAMRPSVQQIFFHAEGKSDIYWQRYVLSMLPPLLREGSIDALLAMVLVSKLSHCMWDAATYNVVTPWIVERIDGMACLQWMPDRLRQALIAIVRAMVYTNAPLKLDAQLARSIRLQRILADVKSHTGDHENLEAVDLDVVLEGSGEIHSKVGSVPMHKSALEVIQRLTSP